MGTAASLIVLAAVLALVAWGRVPDLWVAGLAAVLTYTGSLATLLWRRVVRAADVEPSRGAFFRFAVFATPIALVFSTVMLWLTLRVTG